MTMRPGTYMRFAGLAAFVLALVATGCSGAGPQANAPASTTTTREASAAASISASDAALLKAAESTSDPDAGMMRQVRERALQLADELVAAPLVAESTATLPGSRDSSPLPSGAYSPSESMSGFNYALVRLDPAEYFRATGLRASPVQLRTLAAALREPGVDYEGLGGGPFLRLRDTPVQRCLGVSDASGDPAAYWLRAEKRGGSWVIVGAGRDGSWKSDAYAGKLRVYLRLVKWRGRHSMVAKKPAICLYPSREQSVTVRLEYRGVLTSTAPVIDSATSGWTVSAKPDGTLTDSAGRHWPYLFWEGVGLPRLDLSTGRVVRGAEVDAYLRTALAERGLNANESREFREYWVPLVSANPWVLIHFEGATYERYAPLTVTPKPDVSLRVFMVAKPLERPVTVRPQRLPPAPNRRGFTLVEWGGTLLP